eukprot:14184657-Alexandrium_andersonii.AAC.1
MERIPPSVDRPAAWPRLGADRRCSACVYVSLTRATRAAHRWCACAAWRKRARWESNDSPR